jgi:hypothetical protein
VNFGALPSLDLCKPKATLEAAWLALVAVLAYLGRLAALFEALKTE